MKGTLLEIAKSHTSRRGAVGEPVTDEMVELLMAFLDQDITAAQAAKALGKSTAAAAQNVLSKSLWKAVMAGQVTVTQELRRKHTS